MSNLNPDECGFAAFRTAWPKYRNSVFMNKTEIVTDGNGVIIGVTNRDNLLWASIPDSAEGIQILEVGKGAFSECRKLRSISFSDNLEIIGENAFSACAMLSSVTLPDTLYSLGDGAFEKTGLRSFVFPFSIENVSARLFMDDTLLEGVTLHSGIRKLGILSFAGCSSLRSLDIPAGVREIPEGCFMRSGLRMLYLPHSVERIGNSALSGCTTLEQIFYDGRDEDFRRIVFGKNWNRALNPSVALYIKDRKGDWYNAFSSEGKAAHEEDDVKEALALFGLEKIPSESVLTSLFRKKAMAFHPDRLSSLNLDEEYTKFAEEKFRSYRSAYLLLLPYSRNR